MTRREYLSELDSHLIALPDVEREMALNFYTEYFDEADPDKEQDIIDELGKPFQLAKSIVSEQSDFSKSEAYMRYRESKPLNGGSGIYVSLKKESVPYNPASVPPVQTPAPPAAPVPPPPFPQTGGAQSDGSAEPDIMPGGNPFSNPYAKHAQDGYPNQAAQNYTPPPRTEYGSPYANKPPKKKMSAGMIVLIVLLAVFFGLPVGLPLLGSLLGVALAVIAIVAGVWLSAAGLIIAGVVMFIVGVARVFISPLDGLALIGTGLLLAGLGILFFIPCLLFFTKFLPFCFRGFKSKKKRTARKEEQGYV